MASYANKHEERLGKLREEEAELEALMSGAEQEEQVLDNEEVVAPEEPTEFEKSLTEDIEKDVPAPEDTIMKPADDDLRKQLADAEHRFNRYKGSTDRTLYQLRTEKAEYLKTISILESKITELEQAAVSQPQADVFTQDVIDVLGEDAVNAIKASQASVQDQLTEIRKQTAEKERKAQEATIQAAHQKNERDFMENLEKLVPNLHAMNKDAGFNEWLRQTDDTGVVRLEKLRLDQDDFDYYRVSEYFIEYENKSKTGPQKVTDSVDQHIGPASNGQGQLEKQVDPRLKGTIKQSEINAFNRKVTKGGFKYHPEKAEAFEAKVFKAMNSGKIIFDEKPI